MTNSIPYAVAVDDSPNEVGVCWLDDSDSADGSEQSIDVDGDSYTSACESLWHYDWYRYYVVVGGLTQGTETEVEFPDGSTYDLVAPSTDEITIAVVSDTHWGGYGYTGSQFTHLGDEEPDVFISVGDLVDAGAHMNPESHGGDTDAEKEEAFRDSLEQLYTSVSGQGRLTPIIACTSNHESGAWGVLSDYDPYEAEGDYDYADWRDAGMFQFQYPNFAEGDLGPGDNNFGGITLGDTIQIVSLDSWTYNLDADQTGNTPEETHQQEWLEGYLDESVDHILPFVHQPLHQSRSRSSDDDAWSALMREKFLPIFAEYQNWDFFIGGHMHRETWSERLAITDSDPGSPRYELEDGYYVTTAANAPDGANTYRDIYEGWRNSSRSSPPDSWPIDHTEDGPLSSLVIEVSTEQ